MDDIRFYKAKLYGTETTLFEYLWEDCPFLVAALPSGKKHYRLESFKDLQVLRPQLEGSRIFILWELTSDGAIYRELALSSVSSSGKENRPLRRVLQV